MAFYARRADNSRYTIESAIRDSDLCLVTDTSDGVVEKYTYAWCKEHRDLLGLKNTVGDNYLYVPNFAEVLNGKLIVQWNKIFRDKKLVVEFLRSGREIKIYREGVYIAAVMCEFELKDVSVIFQWFEKVSEGLYRIMCEVTLRYAEDIGDNFTVFFLMVNGTLYIERFELQKDSLLRCGIVAKYQPDKRMLARFRLCGVSIYADS